MLRMLRFLSLLAAILLGARLSIAQVTTGTPPFGSFNGSPDVIDLANLNAHLTIPIFSRPGRGTPFFYNLQYDSSIWYPLTVGGTTTWQPTQNWGLLSQTAVTTGVINVNIFSYTCYTYISLNHTWVETGQTNQYTWYSYTDAFGILHPLNAFSQSNWGSCNGINYPASQNASATAQDGSGYVFTTTNYSVPNLKSRNGTAINAPENVNSGAGSLTDRNGNEISVSSSGIFTDTLGTTALTVSGSGTPASPMTFTYSYPVGPAAIQVNYTNYTVATNFAVSGIHDYKSTAAVPLVSSIVLPDGSQYTFSYEATPSVPSAGACTPYAGTTCVTARVTQITLSTGGYTTYGYSGGAGTNGSGIFNDGSAATLTRTTPDGTWLYAQVKGTGAASTTTITDPQGNVTTIQFQGIYETQRVVKQGATTVLKTSNTCYNGATSPCTGAAITLPITQRSAIITLPNNFQSKQVDSFNSFGMPTESDVYDYSSAATLLRKTIVTYASLGNINAFPQTVTVCNGTGSSTSCNGTGTQIAQTTNNYDETTPTATSGLPQHVAVSTPRGNLTSVNQWLNTTNSNLTSHMTYYDTGMVSTATDPNGHATTYTYSSTFAGAYPTTIANALSQSTTINYDPSGVVTSVTDPNNQTTNFTSYDGLLRLTQVNFPDGGQTNINFNTNTNITTITKMNSSQSIYNNTQLDGLGRVSQTQLQSDPEGTDYTVTTYDPLGRVGNVYSPTRCNPPTTNCGESTWGVTSYGYDALSRPSYVIDPDGSTATANYSSQLTTITDEAGKQRQLQTDALGRITQVTENPGSLGYVTSYTYDALNNLTGVTQNGGRQRTYTFDSLSRLTSETNPESGTVNYKYDGDSNCGNSAAGLLASKTDARSIRTCFSYDALNRLTQKSYSDTTPTAQYFYDQTFTWGQTIGNPIGRMTTFGTISGASYVDSDLFSYDPMGRVISHQQCTPLCSTGTPGGGPFAVNYVYDLAGNATSYTNGFGTTFTQAFDTATRVTQLTSSVSDPQHPGTLATTNSTSGYFPTGAIRSVHLGNSITETTMYNNRLQPCRINANDSNTTLNTCTDAVPNSNVEDFTYGYANGSTNNGNVASWSATGWLNFNRSYSYDTLNRLSTMGDTASSQPCKGLSWTYDAWANRTDQTVTSGTCNTFHQTINTQNRLSSSPYQYDAAGNMTHDASHPYAYDAENRLIAVDGGSTAAYIYDALGRRVKKTLGSSRREYLYDLLSGKPIIEVTNSCATVCGEVGYIYLNGQLVAIGKNATTYFVHADHLGSTRLVTDVTAAYVTDCFDLYPFGEANTPTSPCSSSNPPSRSNTTQEFTGNERDPESNNLDHTLFRQYSSSLARWMHPDPAGLAAVDPSNPQSWNRYAYVLNNPVLFVDPSGLIWACTIAAGTEQCTYYPDDQFTSNYYPGGGGGGGLSYISGPCFGFAGYAHRGCPQPPPPLDVKSLQAAANQNAANRFKACMEDAHNATLVGKAVESGSLLSITPGLNDDWLTNLLTEWLSLPAIKVGGFWALRQTGGVELGSITTGMIKKIPPAGDVVWGAAEKGAREGVIPAIGFATLADTTVALSCKGVINLSSPPLLVPIGIP